MKPTHSYRIQCDHSRVTASRLKYAAVAALIVVVIAGPLVAWFVPSGPNVRGGLVRESFNGAYAGDHYVFWNVIGVSKPVVFKDVRVEAKGPGCHGDVRLVSPRTVKSQYVSAVAGAALPGTSLVGQRITANSSDRLALVLTSSGSGSCSVGDVRVAARSWWRERWTTFSVDFAIDVTHLSGQDPRIHEGAPIPL
jgi:hypothetical protein